MIRKVLLYPLIALLLGVAMPGLATERSPLELVQVHASRATASLLLFRGEGFQDVHAERMRSDLKALDAELGPQPPGRGAGRPRGRGRRRSS